MIYRSQTLGPSPCCSPLTPIITQPCCSIFKNGKIFLVLIRSLVSNCPQKPLFTPLVAVFSALLEKLILPASISPPGHDLPGFSELQQSQLSAVCKINLAPRPFCFLASDGPGNPTETGLSRRTQCSLSDRTRWSAHIIYNLFMELRFWWHSCQTCDKFYNCRDQITKEF